MLSFMDDLLGYHHIAMKPEDIPKTTFVIHRVIYAIKDGIMIH